MLNIRNFKKTHIFESVIFDSGSSHKNPSKIFGKSPLQNFFLNFIRENFKIYSELQLVNSQFLSIAFSVEIDLVSEVRRNRSMF